MFKHLNSLITWIVNRKHPLLQKNLELIHLLNKMLTYMSCPRAQLAEGAGVEVGSHLPYLEI